MTEPLWKYMGGKRKLAPTILSALGSCDRYVEPFVGAGAVALARVEAARPVNRDGKGRGKVSEIVAVLGPTSAPGDVGGSESARDA